MDISKELKSLRLDFCSSTPIYGQIAEYLTAIIRQGNIAPGSKLPPRKGVS